ncbi:MAG: SUMF1/EgtB/PvdO family nonheme iron enzyme, partial [Thermoguttaceae bacterium]|nr:SUMF1/EgtB/PvdO family nonheme iron enzyme [Thermoguttaceae bacterium]
MLDWTSHFCVYGLSNKINLQPIAPKGFEFSLPTEAQWEYACRADSADSASMPDALDTIAWISVNSNGTTHEVGGKKANAWGLYDMLGNVGEWCEDWFDYAYPTHPLTNPTGPIKGSERVYRGGHYQIIHDSCRSTRRFRF